MTGYYMCIRYTQYPELGNDPGIFPASRLVPLILAIYEPQSWNLRTWLGHNNRTM